MNERAEPPRDDAAPPAGPCAVCGYELAGLPRDGRCPECSTPMADAVQAPALGDAPPAVLRAVGGGAKLLTASAVLVAIAGGLILAGVSMLKISMLGLAGGLGLLAWIVFGAASISLLPAKKGVRDPRSRAARVLAVAGALVVPIPLALAQVAIGGALRYAGYAVATGSGPAVNSLLLWTAVWLVLALISAALWAGFARRLLAMAREIGGPELARSAARSSWAILGLLCVPATGLGIAWIVAGVLGARTAMRLTDVCERRIRAVDGADQHRPASG